MAKKKTSDPLIGERDKQVLHFLWRHRICTFQTLKDIFFPLNGSRTTYDRLCKLRRGGHVQTMNLNGTNDLVWGLGKRGLEYLEDRVLPELKARSYKPQSKYHDLLVTAVLLGQWMGSVPRGVKIVSEQELRVTEVLEIPYAIRRKMDHFPDGIWIFTNSSESRGVALEVGTPGKTIERYIEVSSFYASHLFFEHVVWIVPRPTLAQTILDASRKYGMPREGQHLFIEQADFEARLWNSQFLNMDRREQSLADFLMSRLNSGSRGGVKTLPDLVSTAYQQDINTSKSSPLLNFRVSLGRSAAYEKRSKPENR